jgi:hypothetical protein
MKCESCVENTHQIYITYDYRRLCGDCFDKEYRKGSNMNAIVKKIIQGVAAVAPTVANIAVPGSGTLVHDLMRAVTGDNDRVPIDQVAQKIQQNPALMVELQRLAVEREIGLARAEAEKAKADTERVRAVNATMSAESKSEKWPQYAWRPFNGFFVQSGDRVDLFRIAACGQNNPGGSA